MKYPLECSTVPLSYYIVAVECLAQWHHNKRRGERGYSPLNLFRLLPVRNVDV